MSKITKLEIAIIIILIICIGIYLVPYFTSSAEKRKESTLRTNAAIFTSKSLSVFSENKDVKASEVAKKTADELNKLNKNPYNKKLPAYVFENAQNGSIYIQSDDKIQTITITGYTKDGSILVRTLIKPPSFVTYEKEDKSK